VQREPENRNQSAFPFAMNYSKALFTFDGTRKMSLSSLSIISLAAYEMRGTRATRNLSGLDSDGETITASTLWRQWQSCVRIMIDISR
jgi:hypothetical protein